MLATIRTEEPYEPDPESRPPSPGEDPASPSAVYEALLIDHLDFVERTVATLARRYALKPWDADDLQGLVKLKLVADDYKILRKFEGRAKLTTFLTTVIHNLFRDYRIQRWGKWRPSAAAKRIGELGIQLEMLLYRDGFSTRESIEILRDRYDVTASDEDLHELSGSLRARTTRRFEDDTLLDRLEAPERADHRLVETERRGRRRRAENAMRRVVAGLDAEERLILKMRFGDSLTIRAIAQTLEEPPRRMYTRVQALLVRIRRDLEELGVTCEEVMDLVEHAA